MDWIDAVAGIAAIIAAFWTGRAYQKKRMVIVYDVRPQRLYAKDCRKTSYIENELAAARQETFIREQEALISEQEALTKELDNENAKLTVLGWYFGPFDGDKD